MTKIPPPAWPLSLIVLITFFVGMSSPTYAMNTSGFGKAVFDIEAHCAKTCDGFFRAEPARNLTPQILQRLKAWAVKQGQLWGDTILEGDYYLNAPIRLGRVEAIYRGTLFVAYRITYGAPAWYTGECNFNPETKAGLNQCQAGVIFESSFVSADLTEVANDTSHMATFSKKPVR